MQTVDDPILWLDLDGVFTDFRRAVLDRFGIDCEHVPMDGAWAEISADPDFWRHLPEAPGIDDLWAGLRHLNPRFLSGGSQPLRPCAEGKEDWVRDHLGPVPTVVTEARHKPEFCRPGDVLIDDKPSNIEAWRSTGGIGILHTSVSETLAAITELGLDRGWQSASYRTLSSGLRAAHPRPGKVAWILDEDGRMRLMEAFRPSIGRDGNRLRGVCHHILRADTAGADAPLRGFAEIEVVGVLAVPMKGLHLLFATVDGDLFRPDGTVHHIVLARDDDAADAGTVIADYRHVVGDEGFVNLPPDRRLVVHGRWRRLERLRETPPPRMRAQMTETAVAWTFPSGRRGTRIVRVKGDYETTIYQDESGGKHNEGGLPAIESRYLPTDEVRFKDWWEDGARVSQPSAAARSPGL